VIRSDSGYLGPFSNKVTWLLNTFLLHQGFSGFSRTLTGIGTDSKHFLLRTWKNEAHFSRYTTRKLSRSKEITKYGLCIWNKECAQHVPLPSRKTPFTSFTNFRFDYASCTGEYLFIHSIHSLNWENYTKCSLTKLLYWKLECTVHESQWHPSLIAR
jgi:hypothetical protein